MGKINVSKKWIAALTAVTLMGGAAMYTISQNEKSPIENETGYDNVKITNLINLDENDFVILNVGDHNSLGVTYQNEKMSYCNEKDIALGIVITTKAEKENEIYDDVEYVKGLINQHKINFPVYLNIDNIITNDDLNNEMKEKLIRDFLEKCSANKIYVGITGTDTNLCRVKKYCNITGYDAFVIMDSETIKYDGTYYVVKDLDNNIKATSNLESVIEKKGLNNPDKFSNDGTYTISEGEDITDVALKYGMSVTELLKFNNISKNEITAGYKLRIPSIIAKTANTTQTSKFEELKTPIVGCDMSYAQGDSANWEQLQENFEFIILRSNYGLEKDSHFDTNAKNCNIYNIPIGVYCFNTVTCNNSSNLEEFLEKQKNQAEYTLDLLKNKKIEYPVYLDIEGDVSKDLPKEYVKPMLDNWTKIIKEAGYIPGLYCNQSDFQYLQSCVDYDLSEQLEVWIAGGNQYGNEQDPSDNIEFTDVVPSSILYDEEYGATMAQSTNVAINAGAHDGRKHLDINFCRVNYLNEIVEDKTPQDIKEFAFRETTTVARDYVLIPLSGIGIGVVALTKALKRKKKTK